MSDARERTDPLLKAALAKKRSSGEHPAVRSYHAQIDAIEKQQMPDVRAVTERMRATLEKVRSDPRREPDSTRPEGEPESLPPVDVVHFSTRPPVPRPAPRVRVRVPSKPDPDTKS